VATILPILIIDMVLGAGLNLKAPYNNAIKYDYAALPFFCLIAGSLISKSLSLFNKANRPAWLNRKIIFSVAIVSFLVFGATILSSINSAHVLSTSDYLLFRVTMDQAVGYSLFNHAPISQTSLLMYVQYIGFAVILSGFLWASKHRLRESYSSIRRWKEAKST
jgi:hypothetical protein